MSSATDRAVAEQAAALMTIQICFVNAVDKSLIVTTTIRVGHVFRRLITSSYGLTMTSMRL